MYSKISAPYQLSRTEMKIIKSNFSAHNDWDKGAFDQIKSNIIDNLRPKQENKCCYCRRELGFDIKNVDIEHIIPKSLYPKFTFKTKNLALSCPGCNSSKSHKNILRNAIQNYPRSGSNITIIHPHFNDYNSSIKIHNESVFEGLDEKGCETIKICKLYRLRSVVEKQLEHSIKSSPIHQFIEILRNASPHEKADLAAELSNLIAENGT